MESKSIKIVDEHGIDRIGNIICAIDIKGSDYAIYWIERDEENDNIFVSKVLKNLDNTSNLVNIEDTMEKERLSEIVKELIKHAVDSSNNTLDGNTVTLSNGEVVNLSSIIINKEQNINVQKTYITTVKKAVTKVAGDYYVIKEKKEEITNDLGVSMPIFEEPTVSPQVVDIPPIIPEVPVLNIPEELINSSPEPKVMPIEEKKEETVSVSSPMPTQINLDDSAFNPTPEPAVSNIPFEVPAFQPEVPVEPIKPAPVEPVIPTPLASAPAEKLTSVVSEPILIPTPEEPQVASSSPFITPSPEPSLVFDASKESNLNEALGEVSSDKSIPVPSVEPIREFGVDSSVSPVVDMNVQPQESVTPQDNTARSGFANNKFFIVIAITVFLASCVFLGYEAFKYFQLK